MKTVSEFAANDLRNAWVEKYFHRKREIIIDD